MIFCVSSRSREDCVTVMLLVPYLKALFYMFSPIFFFFFFKQFYSVTVKIQY